MKRRDFCKASAAGAALASISGSRGFAQAGADDRPRFLFILEGNGVEPASMLCDSARARLDEQLGSPIDTARWWYRRTGGIDVQEVSSPDLAQSNYLSSQFGTAFPLEPLAEQGLVDDATVILGLSSRIVGGGHVGLHGALSSTRTLGGRPAGQTIDAYLARLPRVRGTMDDGNATPFDAFRVGVGNRTSIDFGTCAYDVGTPAPLIRDLQAAYEFAYAAFATGASRDVFERQSRLLEFAGSDVESARAAFTGNQSERDKLDRYRAAIAELQTSQALLSGMSITPPPPPESGLDALGKFDALLDLATSTLIDGLAPVAVVGSGTGGDFSLTYSSVSTADRHNMQHGSAADAVLLDAIRQVNRAQVASIARAARRLKDAGMLERTVIVWLGDNGEQHHSTASEFPVLLLGGTSVGLRPGGRTILYPGVASDNNRQLSNLWNTLGYVAGESLDTFGGEAGTLRKAPGPLGELMV